MLSFFPRGVLDEILNLIESVSEEFPSYSCQKQKTSSDLSISEKKTKSQVIVGPLRKERTPMTNEQFRKVRNVMPVELSK